MAFGGKALLGLSILGLVATAGPASLAAASPTRAGDDPAFAESGLTSVAPINGRGWSLTATVGTRYDSNILRLSDQLPLRAGDKRGDFLISPRVTGAIAMPIGRQQVYVGAEIGRDFYTNNKRLNRNRYSIGGGINLRAGSACTGSVGAEFNSRQSLLSDVAFAVPNRLERLSYGVSASCQAPVGLGFGGTVQRIEQRNSDPVRATFDVDTTVFAPQVSYGLPVLGRFSLSGSYNQSRYVRRQVTLLDGTMKNDGVNILNGRAGFQRPLGTRLSLNMGVSYLSAKPQPQTVLFVVVPGFGFPTNRPAFSGIGYDASIEYVSGARLSAGLEARRTVSATTTAGSQYRVQQDYGFNVDYKLGRALAVGTGVTYNIFQYRGSFTSPLEPLIRVSDKITRVYGTINYTPVKLYSVGLEVAHQNRESLPALYSFKSTSVLLTLRVNLGRES